MLVLELKLSSGKESVLVVSVYNPPPGAERAGRSADILINVPEVWQRRLLIIGDINLHHTDWDNCIIQSTSPAQRFAGWVTDNNGSLQLEPGVATHAKGGTLDLVISSNTLSEQITECYVEPYFHVTSDHETIVTRLELEKPSSRSIGQQKFRLNKMDEKKFVIGLEAQKDLAHAALASAQRHNPSNVKRDLDESAETITKAIYSSLQLSMERSKGCGKGEPWWNEDCRSSLDKMRQTQRYLALNKAAGILTQMQGPSHKLLSQISEKLSKPPSKNITK